MTSDLRAECCNHGVNNVLGLGVKNSARFKDRFLQFPARKIIETAC